MKTRLILTLLLILLAAVIAAAAIFFLLARPVPPADTGAGSPAPPSAGPSLTIVAETITDKATGQPLTGDVCLNGALLRSLGRSVLHPQHYTAKRYSATNLEYNEWLSGRENSFVSQFVVVSHFQVTVPMDGSAEIRVTAPGYKPWGIRPRGGGSDKVMRGPVQLVRE
jgi:hypothetical protein